jgi:hypothetical protein
LPAGRQWDAEREAAADAVIDQVSRFAPNFKSSVIGRRILSPLDLEREFGLVGGDIFHGKLTLEPAFQRPPGPGARGLPHAGRRSLPVRVGRPPRRGCHRRPRAQRGAGDPAGPRPPGLKSRIFSIAGAAASVAPQAPTA